MRKTIGILIDHIDQLSRGYEFELRGAFDAICRQRDVELLIFVGRALNDPDPWMAVHNVVYELPDPRCVDGLILVASSLAAFTGAEGVSALAERFAGIPLCSFGLELPGVPSVVLDTESGMRSLLEHIVADHGCTRLAFLGGPVANPDSAQRFQAFRSVLARHGLPVDPNLIRFTDFTFSKGRDAMQELLRQGASFEAVICANDAVGLGATEALRAANLRVPLNVRVTGFDDLLMSRLGDPPLSTVRQPLAEMADAAVELVLNLIEGRGAAERIALAADFIARESCGCGTHVARPPSLPPESVGARGAYFVRCRRSRLVELLRAAQRSRDGKGGERVEQLLNALEAELGGERLAFLATIEALLGNTVDNEVFEDMQRSVTVLRDVLRETHDPDLEELWHEARTQISLLNTRAQVRQRTMLEDRYDRLLRVGERFSTNLDLGSLKKTLREELPIAQVEHAFVSLYAAEDRKQLELFLDLGTLPAEREQPLLYAAGELFPAGACRDGQRRTWIVMPLTFESECLGVVAFEHANSFVAYSMFRDRISTAFKTASMHHEVVKQTAAHERNRQERLAAAARIKSLSALAGGVAHDLNNALGPLAALPDLIVQELAELDERALAAKSEIMNDLLTIKSSALRAAQTIKDLLTLGRQRQVSKETLDLNRLIASCTAGLPNELAAQRERSIELVCALAAEPLFVHASESHLTRAITNLTRNAAESIPQHGHIVVRTYAVTLSEPISGYELIEPGDYAAVSVADSGEGIPSELLTRIFEPFFSSKKLRDSSGSGLGLAIVHGVVKEHGGFINVETKIGAGTVFTLYFPRAQAAARPRSEQPANLGRGSGRLLIVDDDVMQLRTSRRVLERAGFDVITADCAARAYDIVQSEAERSSSRPVFDLVILDMILNDPEDGLDVFERIRGWFPAQRGILVSGHAPMERGALALQRGMSWLGKPYTAEALIEAVRAALVSGGEARRLSSA